MNSPVKVFKPKQGRLVWVSMRSTGIEPVSTPWKGAILPLNYERRDEGGSLHSRRRMFIDGLNALIGQQAESESTQGIPQY